MITIMPTRGRPLRAMQAYTSYRDTKELISTHMLWVLDEGDPMLDVYAHFASDYNIPSITTTGNMVQRTNYAAAWCISVSADIIGWTADDQLFRTAGWDTRVRAEFQNPSTGFVMTNDLHYGAERPVNIYTRWEVIRALGYFALPTLEHLYVDNVWHDLGTKSGSMVYLEDVIVEHMHPGYGKSDTDAQYQALHGQNQYTKDGDAYTVWQETTMNADIERIRNVLSLS